MNSQLQAAQSYWAAKRDEAKANLDILLTKSSAFENPQQQVNFWIKELSDAQTVLTTVNLIIESLNKSQPGVNKQ